MACVTVVENNQQWPRSSEQLSPIFKGKHRRVEDAELSTAASVLVDQSMNARCGGQLGAHR